MRLSSKCLLIPVATVSTIVLVSLAKPVLAPLLLAALLAQFLAPLVRKLELFLPALVAALLALVVMITAMLSVLALVSEQTALLSADLPEIQTRLADTWDHTMSDLTTHLGMTRSNQVRIFENIFASAVHTGTNVALSIFTITVITVADTVLIFIFTFFILYYRRHLNTQLRHFALQWGLPPPSLVFKQVLVLVQRYVAGLLIVVAVVGGLDSLGFIMISAPYPILYGLCGALAVLIPYIGIIAVGTASVILTFASTGLISQALAVAGVFTVVHLLEANLISPALVGRKVNLNPMATLLAVLIGAATWGAIGMLLFIPLAGIAKLALESSPSFEALARIMGPPTSNVWTSAFRRIGHLFPRVSPEHRSTQRKSPTADP